MIGDDDRIGTIVSFVAVGRSTLIDGEIEEAGPVENVDGVTILVHMGIGNAEAEWLGCDLSREYIAINADYTT